jgi:hypothetical protein
VIRVLDRVIMQGMSAWEFSLFNPVRDNITNGAFIEYKRFGSEWQRRQSVPHLGEEPGPWIPIIPIRKSRAELSELIERVLERVRD